MVVISSLVLAHCQLGVRASGPVELQVNSRRIVTRVGDDLLENRAQDLLLQPYRRLRVIPCPIQIIAQGKQLGALFGVSWGAE